MPVPRSVTRSRVVNLFSSTLWRMPLRPPSICAQCRIQLQYPRLFHATSHVSRSSKRPRKQPHAPPNFVPGSSVQLLRPRYTKEKTEPWRRKIEKRVLPRNTQEVKGVVLDHLRGWEHRPPVRTFMDTLGIRDVLRREELRRFKDAIRQELEGNEGSNESLWDWTRIEADMALNLEGTINRALMRRFVKLMPTIAPEHCQFLEAVDDALALPHPAEWHPTARQVHRKIILHVGPTNSGKTYHALRALAGAKYGCYAGPLRLLATEVFNRLNRGDIAPPDGDPSKKHPRVCNLYTGENVKIVDEDAGLMSATVEMVPLNKKFDVVVIDEIQMVGHCERGSAWTQALLGVNAEEIHLCGEESAVELVKELVRPAGDEVIVNRYKRLTPLQIAPRSLRGDLTAIQPGDCVVAFSRNAIFGLKTLIEEKTGLRCAVAYGKLPPEVRVEQATKFNSGVSGDTEYPVLVASDAIGMGLNLKIKRIIFSSCHKWDGYKNVQLPLSDIKQIAGRAGRYGMHGADAIGTATTLLASEYRILENALRTSVPNLTTAILAPDSAILSKIYRTLPPRTGLTEIFQLLQDISTLEKPFALTDYAKLMDAAMVVDAMCPQKSIAIRSVLVQAPVPWRVEGASPIFEQMLSVYASGQKVDPEAVFTDAGLMVILEDVADAQEEAERRKEVSKEGSDPGHDTPVLKVSEASSRLEALELLHKMACVYLWMSYRFPIAFPETERTEEIKLAAESGIEFCLEMIQTDRAKVMSKRIARALEDEEAMKQKLKNTRLDTAEGVPTELLL